MTKTDIAPLQVNVIADAYEITAHIGGSKPLAHAILGLYGWQVMWRDRTTRRLRWMWIADKAEAIRALEGLAAARLIALRA